ncbi:hypothetical protein PIB30_005602 [Stylosanthes scabra]|uniref:Uncharacterized protein n=1 Tax=Stylosanthes scabra TaxID=79078 RepID=A0ABU6S3T0_9FABA|nr:hypothetical protein [Stylosanthes scabra]
MDKFFAQQIGRNMEIYVDDMVAKTPHGREGLLSLDSSLELPIDLITSSEYFDRSRTSIGPNTAKPNPKN